MTFFEKLDELIEKLDAPTTDESQLSAAENNSENIIQIENNTQSAIINEQPIAETDMQNESSEDAKSDETIEKLSNVILKQNEQIESLKKQMSTLINNDAAQINDGANVEPAQLPDNVPNDYVALKDLDYSMNY